MRHASGHVTTAAGHGHLEGIDSQPSLHSSPDGVADDPRGVDVLDRAHVQLALIGVMFRDIHSSLTAVAWNSCRTRPSASTTAHRSSWTGGPGLLPFFARALPKTENHELAEHSRHAVRTA